MTADDILLQPARTTSDAALDRAQALELTRERLDPSVRASDEEIWQAWTRVAGGGPTLGDDLGRVVAELEGIAVDG